MKTFLVCRECGKRFINHICDCDNQRIMAISCTEIEYNKLLQRERHQDEVNRLRREVSERLNTNKGEMSNE